MGFYEIHSNGSVKYRYFMRKRRSEGEKESRRNVKKRRKKMMDGGRNGKRGKMRKGAK